MQKILLYSLSFVLGSLCHAQISLKDTVHKGGVFNNCFTENKGQVGDFNSNPRPDILFSGSTKNMSYFFRQQGISYQLYKVDTWKQKSSILGTDKFLSLPDKDSLKKQSLIPDKMNAYRLDINWLNCNRQTTIITGNAIGGYTNYYLAVCPNGVNGVKTYQSITYKNIYKGIDLVWYDKNNALKYDYMVAAGADYKNIQSQILGAENISLNQQGELVISTPLGEIIEQAPLVMQQGRELKATWQIKNNIVSFDIEGVNTKLPFVIDPGVRNWGTYYGGGGNTNGNGSSADKYGNVYFVGTADGFNDVNIISTPGSFQVMGQSNMCAFLVKFKNTGQRKWGTFYGGHAFRYSQGNSCATDLNGNVYLVGTTDGTTNISSPGSYQPNAGGETDAYLAKFDSLGSRLWATFYGGNGYERGYGCSTDALDNVYFAGTTEGSEGIATANAHQPNSGGQYADAFLAKFNGAGQRLWATYYGGDAVEEAYSCPTDINGNVYLCGYSGTQSGTSIATPGSHQPQCNTGVYSNAFLAKFNAAGQRQWGTYYGGNNSSFASSCAPDALGNVYLAGSTDSDNGTTIATPTSHQPNYGGGGVFGCDGFLVKFSATGARLWGTYYGDVGNDFVLSCAVDVNNNVYIAGGSESSTGTIIATPGTQQTNNNNTSNFTLDSFIASFNPNGKRHWGTYYGGTGIERGGCSLDDVGNIYFCGTTQYDTGNTLATAGSQQPTYGGGTDAIFAQFNNCITPSANFPFPKLLLATSANSLCSGESLSVSIYGADSYVWTPGSLTSASITLIASSDINYTITGSEDSLGCRSKVVINIPVTPTPTLNVTPFSYLCSGNATLNASGAETFLWLPDNINGNIAMVSPPATSNYTVIGANGTCTSSAVSIVSIGIAPPLYISASNLSGCQNTCFTFSTASNEFSPHTFFWGEDAPANALLNSHCYTTSGNYEVIAHATFSSGCSVISANTLSITIFPIPSSEIEIYNEKEFSNGEPITFRNISQGAQTYHWVFGDQSNFPVSYSTSDVEHVYAKPGNYCVKLIVTDTVFKCTDTTIQCIDVLCGSKINIPNIFTPNGDGANDVFTFTTKCIKSLSCSIYDRWGNPVHSWNDINGWWDGRTTSGLLCSAGTYFFVLEYTTEANINMKKSGNFFLMD